MDTARTTAPLGISRIGVIGLGRVGSAVVPHVARLGYAAGLRSLLLVDHDVLTADNLEAQGIPAGVRRAKASLAADQARAVCGELDTETVVGCLEQVPLGRFRDTLLIGALDSRVARYRLNCYIAGPLGLTWIDTGIRGNLVRVSIYDAADPAGPCYVCGFGPKDHDTMAQALYPCVRRGGGEAQAATGNQVGAVAGAMAAMAAARLLAGDRSRVGREELLDLDGRTFRDLALPRNPHCPEPHAPWELDHLDAGAGRSSIAALLLAGVRRFGGPVALELVGHTFSTALRCTRCGGERRRLRLLGRLTDADATCRKCGGELDVGNTLLLHDRLRPDELTPRTAATSLRTVGLRTGDIVTMVPLRGGAPAHLELT